MDGVEVLILLSRETSCFTIYKQNMSVMVIFTSVTRSKNIFLLANAALVVFSPHSLRRMCALNQSLMSLYNRAISHMNNFWRLIGNYHFQQSLFFASSFHTPDIELAYCSLTGECTQVQFFVRLTFLTTISFELNCYFCVSIFFGRRSLSIRAACPNHLTRRTRSKSSIFWSLHLRRRSELETLSCFE